MITIRIQDIKVGEYYRLASTKGCGEFNSGYNSWVKVLEVFKKGQYNNPDPKKRSVIKCEHTVYKTDVCGFTRYFRPSELVKENK